MLGFMKKFTHLIFLFLISTFFVSTIGFAQGGPPIGMNENEWKFSIGAGAIVKTNNRENNIYKRHDKEFVFTPLPYLTASYSRFSLGGQGISARLIGFKMVNISAQINRGGDKYLGVGMSKRKQALFGGLSAKYFKWGLAFSHDINGYSKGYQGQLSYSEFIKLSDQWVLRSSLNLEWFDDHYANYYFGVRNSEATSTRPAHYAQNFFHPGISFMPIYSFKEDWSLVNILSFKFQPKKLRDSPTVNDKKFESMLLMALNYSIN